MAATDTRSRSSLEAPTNSDAECGDQQIRLAHATPATSNKQNEDHEDKYPPFATVMLIMLSLYMAVFLVALDTTIISTAIPRISDEFHSLDDIGWYGSAYLLTLCCFQLLFGRIYTFYSPKLVFLTAVFLFEVGSAICGAAPNSVAFIFGRAVAGVGAAGISGGAAVIIVHTVPIHKRPVYMGNIGAVYGLASVAGPLLGGVFTDRLSWRWCFYINLPIGGLTLATIFLSLKLPGAKDASTTIREQIRRLDPLGTFFFFPGIVCLLLVLQWGGSKYSWQDARMVALLVIFALCMATFVAIQIWNRESGTVPPRIFLQRSILSGCYFGLLAGSALMILIYYLPIWFQAIKGVNAVTSGLMTLPVILSLVVANMIGGIVVSRIGYYAPFMIASSILISVGSGLITTFTTTTNHPKWIGYQVIFGLGIGLGMQQPGVAAQTVLTKKDVPTGIALMMFFRNLGGALFISISQNVLQNDLIKGLKHIRGLDTNTILESGATGLRKVVDAQDLQQVLVAYNGALTKVFYCAVAVSCASIVGALTMEWRSVKKAREQQRKEATKPDEKRDDAV
ncbi:hypothetical protein LTR84_009405 [Exophiala bonariae]|uniref:Major facilitator superfamily (MFS) profile domain-containing protein n=1 Tax=Exophiala bonariae TaxID=1690606 RepID=A0AAV9MUL6_9EURO|nr:hypothetical protein LTR84_009405 [Exophiala bonariae]